MVRGSALSLLTQVVNNAGAFIAVLALARGLGPTGRGVMAFVVVATLTISKLGGLGIGEAMLVLAAQYPEKRRSMITSVLAFVVVSVGLVTAAGCALLLAVPSLAPAHVGATVVIAIGVAVIGTAVQGAFYSFLLGCKRLRAMPLSAVAAWIYAIVVVIAAFDGRLTVGFAAWSFAIAQTLGAVCLLAVALRGNGFGRIDFDLIRTTVRFGVRAWVGSLAGYLNFRVDQILMAYLATESALGLYSVAVNTSELLLYLPTAAATAIAPAIAGAARDVQVAATLRAVRTLMLITVVTVVIAAVCGPFLIPLVFGHDFKGAVVPFLLLLAGTFGWTIVGVLTRALIASSAPGRSSIGLATALVSGVVLDVVLIPPFGASGAAVAATGAFLAGGVASVVTYRRLVHFPLADLVPGRADVEALRRLVRRAPFLRQRAAAS